MVGVDGYDLTQQLKADDPSLPTSRSSSSPTKPSEALRAEGARRCGAAAHLRRVASRPRRSLDEGPVARRRSTPRRERRRRTAPGDRAVRASGRRRRAAAAATARRSPSSAPATPSSGGYGAPRPAMAASRARAPSIGRGRRRHERRDVPHIDDLLRLMIERGGSDLHITVGQPSGHPPARRDRPDRGHQAALRRRTRRR